MRGLGTPTGTIYPGYIRRINEGTVQNGSTYATSIGMWQLVTTETAALVEAANYFNAWVNDLPVGSIIFASMALGGTPKFKIYMVTANTGTVVTVSLQTTIAG